MEHKVEIIYKELDGSIQVQMNTGGLSPYTVIGIFEHFIDQMKERLKNPEQDVIFPDQQN